MTVACGEDYFKCGTGRCVLAAYYFCDGNDNCGDWSDEKENCSE